MNDENECDGLDDETREDELDVRLCRDEIGRLICSLVLSRYDERGRMAVSGRMLPVFSLIILAEPDPLIPDDELLVPGRIDSLKLFFKNKKSFIN